MSNKPNKLSLWQRILSVFRSESAQEKSVPIPEEQQQPSATETSVNQEETIFNKPMAVKKVAYKESPKTEPETLEKDVALVEDADLVFAQNFVTAGGNFIFCESKNDLYSKLKMLLFENKWKLVYFWEQELRKMFDEINYQTDDKNFNLQSSQVVFSLCESLVVEDGSIVLGPGQSSARSMQYFPDAHVIIANKSLLQQNHAMAVKQFKAKYPNQLPSAVFLPAETLADNKSKGGNMILNSTGTQNIWLLYLDDFVLHE